MKTVLHLIDTTGPGGAETVFMNLFEAFDRDGFRSVPLVTDGSWVQGALQARGNATYECHAKGSLNTAYLKEIVRVVRTERVDLIQGHLFGASVYASLAGLLTRRRVVSILHGSVDVARDDRKLWPKVAAVNLGSDRIVTVSGRLRDDLLGRTSLKASKMQVIHNGVDTSRFTGSRSTALRQELGLGPDAFIVCCLGNIRSAKGYPHLIEAAARVLPQAPNIHFVVAGEGKKRGRLLTELLEQRSAAGLDEHVHFLGFRSDSVEILTGSDLFLLPSTSEGFSISTIEAMACGLPVVATRSGGPEEIVTPGVDGLLVPPADGKAIADAVLELYGDPGRRSGLAKAAVSTVAERFSLEAQVGQYEALCRELLAYPRP